MRNQADVPKHWHGYKAYYDTHKNSVLDIVIDTIFEKLLRMGYSIEYPDTHADQNNIRFTRYYGRNKESKIKYPEVISLSLRANTEWFSVSVDSCHRSININNPTTDIITAIEDCIKEAVIAEAGLHLIAAQLICNLKLST